MEQWKAIPGYEDLYEVSDLGNVRNVKTKKKLKFQKTKNYHSLKLSKNGKTNRFYVHQLVAITFLSHFPNKKTNVDHINFIKTDNRLENLQIITPRENKTRSIDRSKTTSKFHGVYFRSDRKKWVSNIRINGKQKFLGYFTNELEAAEAYQKALEDLNHTHLG